MSHEYPLENLPDEPFWSENYAAMFVEPTENIIIFLSVGRWYADPSVWREVIGIGLPGGRVVYTKNYGRNVKATGPGAALGSWEAIVPERSLQLRFDGPVHENSLEELNEFGWREGPMRRLKVSLDFEALHPLWEMRGTSHEAQTVAGGMHLEQIGSVNGTIEYDKVYQFKNAYCIRDHSRGVRDPKDFYRYCWISGHFPQSNRGFYVYLMESRDAAGHGMANAVVSDGTKLYPAEVSNAPYLAELADAEALPALTLTSELGTLQVRATRRIGRVLNSFWKPFDNSIGFTRYINSTYVFADGIEIESDGEIGTGWCERGLAPKGL